jgi:catechol 2,3-dioxygenase-like lactoylglutathione lyase family enzyme
MHLKEINHVVFITDDIVKTIRFYRDLLGMELTQAYGGPGIRHYFFKTGNNEMAFFEYPDVKPIDDDAQGGPANRRQGGFDHISFNVRSKEELFAVKDRVEAAGIAVNGVLDHGMLWSFYFDDPNGIELEVIWPSTELVIAPAEDDANPLPIVAEGSKPQPGHWPDVGTPTLPENMTCKEPSAGYDSIGRFLDAGIMRRREGFVEREGLSDAAD